MNMNMVKMNANLRRGVRSRFLQHHYFNGRYSSRVFSTSPSSHSSDPYPRTFNPPPVPPLPQINPERPESSLNEDSKTMRARLLYNTRKRGILETDLLLSTFATRERLDGWDLDKLREFDRFLTLPDWTIYYLSIGKQDPPEGSELDGSWMIKELREHAKNKDKVTRKMPDL